MPGVKLGLDEYKSLKSKFATLLVNAEVSDLGEGLVARAVHCLRQDSHPAGADTPRTLRRGVRLVPAAAAKSTEAGLASSGRGKKRAPM